LRQTVQINFGIGDTVYPEPQVIGYPVILASARVRLNAWSMEAALNNVGYPGYSALDRNHHGRA